ncbi:RNA polymerase sigma factor [Psychrobium sp. nBUS_13]|uniref:RNA polymerase sigma factor n=1 Tax=Psychrobium sp. nBUS_13 TaxID=3395319 RepID=UPI003EC0224A
MTLDTEIIKRMLNGEDQAFAQCYELTSAIVYSAIFRICQNKDSAQDILQETQ